MPSAGLPFPTSNNAPLPVPGGYGNPSGFNFGNFGSTTGQPFPTMPAYGGYGPPAIPHAGGATNPVFQQGSYASPAGAGGFSGPAYNVGSYGTGAGLAGLSSGFAPYGQGYGTDFYNMLGRAYGKGTGQLLGNVIGGGLFNPQVAAAFLNAQQPGIARGEAGILGAFGDAGARFSSAAALGMGDYESQVQLNQQQMLAQMYQNAQQMQLNELNQVLPTIQQERANEGGWLNTVLGGVEMAGALALTVATGGAASPLLIPAMGLGAMGASTMGKGHGAPQGGGAVNPQMGNMWTPYNLPGYGGNTGTFGTNAPVFNPQTGQVNDPQVQPSTLSLPQAMQQSGGGLLGGATDLTNPNMDWLAFLSQ